MRVGKLEDDIRRIVATDPRYPYDAYVFVQEALEHTQRSLGRTKIAHKHVAGKELLEGLRQYALDSFGPMVPTVFGEWGIHNCEDIGEIVFNMIDHGIATKTDSDKREDFAGNFSFDDAFRKPFLPAKPAVLKPKLADPKVSLH
ncbi:MAG: Minf_1886 family protein [Limisphaerales bacterium]